MIRFEMNPEAPGVYTVIIYGEHIKILKNPRLAAKIPFWQQELMANAALRLAVPSRPVRAARRRTDAVAEVVCISTLREAREARVAAAPDVRR